MERPQTVVISGGMNEARTVIRDAVALGCNVVIVYMFNAAPEIGGKTVLEIDWFPVTVSGSVPRGRRRKVSTDAGLTVD